MLATRKCSVASSSCATSVDDRIAATRAWPWLGRQHGRQPIEELAHAWRQHFLEPGESVGEVALERRSGDGLEQVTTQVERAELGEGETGLDAFEDLTVDAPVDVAVTVAFVVERKARLLQRGEIPSDGACGDVELAGQRVDGHTMTRRLQRVEDTPLADRLPGCEARPILSTRQSTLFFESTDLPSAPAIGGARRLSRRTVRHARRGAFQSRRRLASE